MSLFFSYKSMEKCVNKVIFWNFAKKCVLGFTICTIFVIILSNNVEKDFFYDKKM